MFTAGPLQSGSLSGRAFDRGVLRVMDEIASISKPVIILTGGEPLLRPDIFDLARYGTNKGFRMVMATNGTLITEEIVQEDEGLRDSADQHQPRRP